MMPFILKAPCKDYIWGGNRLREYGKQSDGERIAESWELSCHPDGESVIAEGEFAGMTLSAFLKRHPEAMGTRGAALDRFPVLVKLIDAKDDLSVQVHPDDAYAQRAEGEPGKTEMWYVVDAQPGAQLICGFEKSISREELRRAIEENTLLDIVHRVPVKKGDVCFIPAGTLHAIGKGLLIAEVQQNSNLTYRVYDYGRAGTDGKPRTLHIEKALDVTRREPAKPCPAFRSAARPGGGSFVPLVMCDTFFVFKEVIRGSTELCARPDSFMHLLVTEGRGKMQGEDGVLSLEQGTSVFVPAGGDTFQIQGECTVIQTLI